MLQPWLSYHRSPSFDGCDRSSIFGEGRVIRITCIIVCNRWEAGVTLCMMHVRVTPFASHKGKNLNGQGILPICLAALYDVHASGSICMLELREVNRVICCAL